MSISPTNNDTPYVKTKDIVTVKFNDGYHLRSHDFTFAINEKTFQEVVGHKERIGGNDEVLVSCLYFLALELFILFIQINNYLFLFNIVAN